MNSIVLVEDNVNNQLVIEDLFELEEIGAQLIVFSTAEEALEGIESMKPMLVLMDIGLPGMSGIEATRVLKSNTKTADIPVWALTAHALKQSQDEALAAGCAEYVTKPLDSAQLAERLRLFIERHGLKGAA